MDNPILGAFVRCHQRADTLDIVLSELLRYNTFGILPKISIFADHPSWQVERVIEKYKPRLFSLKYSPYDLPLVSSRGERFMQALNLQLKAFDHTHTDWMGLYDDDRYFLRPSVDSELPSALGSDEVDVWYANSVFMQDERDKYNPNRHHQSVAFWRTQRGDTFPTDRMIQATAGVHDDAIMSGRTGLLKTPLLDYGTFTSDERLRVHEAYRRAGKIDAYTDAITAPCQLAVFNPPAGWRDLYTEAQQKTA